MNVLTVCFSTCKGHEQPGREAPSFVEVLLLISKPATTTRGAGQGWYEARLTLPT